MPTISTREGFHLHTDQIISIEPVSRSLRWCRGSHAAISLANGAVLYVVETPEQVNTLISQAVQNDRSTR